MARLNSLAPSRIELTNGEAELSGASVDIRACNPADFPATRQLVREAFAAVEPEETVVFLDGLRTEGCILGEWVAEDASGLLGHIAFSRIWVDRRDGQRIDAVILTPLAVRVDRQRTGIGTRLMTHSLAELRARGERLFFVLGYPAYYARVGFSSEAAAAVASPWSGKAAYMALGDDIPTGSLVLPKVIAEAH